MKRFWAKLAPHTDWNNQLVCWEWIGAKNEKGYGRFFLNGKNVHAHRVAYELTNGPIPSELWVLHKCDNPACCNPSHLFLGTHIDNIIDMDLKGRRASTAGELHGKAKFKRCDIIEIRSSPLSSKKLSNLYNVHRTTIERIRSGKHWRAI